MSAVVSARSCGGSTGFTPWRTRSSPDSLASGPINDKPVSDPFWRKSLIIIAIKNVRSFCHGPSMSMAPSILVGVKWKQLKTEVGGQRTEVRGTGPEGQELVKIRRHTKGHNMNKIRTLSQGISVRRGPRRKGWGNSVPGSREQQGNPSVFHVAAPEDGRTPGLRTPGRRRPSQEATDSNSRRAADASLNRIALTYGELRQITA